MSEFKDVIRRIVEKSKFKREKFDEVLLEKNYSNVIIVPFFGDSKSEFLFATTLLHKVLEKYKDSYKIVCSWPGASYIYPYVHEYWTIDDADMLLNLKKNVNGFSNDKNDIDKMFFRYFDHVLFGQELIADYYDQNGFTKKYFEVFNRINYRLPSVLSANISNIKLSNNKKNILVYPNKYAKLWNSGRTTTTLTDEGFWRHLINSLLSKNLHPVVCHFYDTHDMRKYFNEKVSFIESPNLMYLLSVMRSSDCVLDVFSGISRYAIMARSPYFSCQERQCYFNCKEYEIEELFAKNIPKKVSFSFLPFNGSTTFDQSVDLIINKLMEFLPNIDRNALPTSVEINSDLPYNEVRDRELKMLGLRIILPDEI